MKLLEMTFARVRFRYPYFLIATLIVFAFGVPLARAQGDCKLVFDASEKLTVTPHHGYSTHLQPGGKQVAGEDISVGGVIYVQVRGRWRKSPLTVQDRLQQQQENRKSAKNLACSHVRDEVVNGEAAEVYKAHAETEDLKSDSVVWISKSKGLILRQEEDLDMMGDKSHVSARYEYADISAPSVSP